MLPVFLCIETSTLNCSVAVFRGSECLSLVEEAGDSYVHGEMLHVFMERALREAGVKASDLTAVGVTRGPGSYTGLRIGVSAAKGLCFSMGIPLYSVESLRVLAASVQSRAVEGNRILALIDARRMEVYSALFDPELNQIGETRAEVVESTTFDDRAGAGSFILCGDAQEKLRDVLTGDYFEFTEVRYPSARAMGKLISDKIETEQHEDVAYFEPFYLKDFVAGTPRKSPLK